MSFFLGFCYYLVFELISFWSIFFYPLCMGSSISLVCFVVCASQISSLFPIKAFHLTQSCVLFHFAWSSFSTLTIGVLLGSFSCCVIANGTNVIQGSAN
jgi:hypothetical protein